MVPINGMGRNVLFLLRESRALILFVMYRRLTALFFERAKF